MTLGSLVDELRRTQRVCFVPIGGNAGDAVIDLGTFHFFDRHGLPFPTLVPQSEKVRIKEFDLVIFNGGGNLVRHYEDGINLLRYAVGLGKQVVVFPSSTFGYEKILVGMADRLRFFARESVSFERLKQAGFPAQRLGLEDDMALQIDEGFFSDLHPERRLKTAYCLRKDRESCRGFCPLPPENVDISATWVGDLWQSRQFIESVVRSLASYLLQFESVVTDRLHVAVLAAMLKLQVRLLPNSYYKNHAVFMKSLKGRFPGVEFVDERQARRERRRIFVSSLIDRSRQADHGRLYRIYDRLLLFFSRGS